jgi:D-beta-D-heptose 7-phosphate kinase/D-beta-D-heptose 1-phosphate adenosyltransferase
MLRPRDCANPEFDLRHMSRAPPETELADAIKKLARASVLVVGDVMLDRYVFGDVSRISPEAPVPVLAVERDLALPGGAGNVVRNLTALGAAVAFVSVVGDDQSGSDLTGLIGGQPNVEPWLLVQGGRCTTVKTRFIARGQQLLRSDQEHTGAIHPKLAERLFRIVTDAQAATSVTVLSDYAKGVLAGDVAPRIIAAARELGRPIVVSPRGEDLDRFVGADVVVFSLRHVAAATGMDVSTPSRIAAAARWLRTAHGFGAVVVNRGENGLSVVTAEAARHVPYAASEIFDFSGAADTAVSALAAGLAVGLDLFTAARVAALAMGVVAGRPGMATARGTDLLAMLTPRGRALRKIVGADIALEQVARWRRAGLRTGFLATTPGQLDRARLDAARAGCDRLVLAVEAPPDPGENPEPPPALAHAAGWSSVDLLCVFGHGGESATIELLRPELVIDPSPSAALADIVGGWGGELVAG